MERKVELNVTPEAITGGRDKLSLCKNSRTKCSRIYNLSNSTGDVTASNNLRQKKVNSVYGTLGFNYKKAVFFGMTGRNDWSSALPVEHNSYSTPLFL